MFSHVSDVPCLPLSSYRASLDGEAHVSPAAFEQCASAILRAYRSHYQTVGLTVAQAEYDAELFIESAYAGIPAEVKTAAGFPSNYMDPLNTDLATDATDEPEEAEPISGLAARGLAHHLTQHATLAADRDTLRTFAQTGDIGECLAICQRQIEEGSAAVWWNQLSRYFIAELEGFASDGNGADEETRTAARRQLGYGVDETGSRYELAICPICHDVLYGPHEACDVYVLTHCPEDPADDIRDASARYDRARASDPERQTAAEIIKATRENATRFTPEFIQKAIRDLDARILRLKQYAAQDEESERPDYRANAKRRRARMIAERELRAAVLKNL